MKMIHFSFIEIEQDTETFGVSVSSSRETTCILLKTSEIFFSLVCDNKIFK